MPVTSSDLTRNLSILNACNLRGGNINNKTNVFKFVYNTLTPLRFKCVTCGQGLQRSKGALEDYSNVMGVGYRIKTSYVESEGL